MAVSDNDLRKTFSVTGTSDGNESFMKAALHSTVACNKPYKSQVIHRLITVIKHTKC